MHSRAPRRSLNLAVRAVCLWAAALPAQAALTVYTSVASFQAAISAAGTDTFEEASAGGSHASPFARSAGAYSYQATATGGFYGSGTGAASALSTDTSGTAITLSGFSGSIAAIGANVYGTDINGLFYSGNLQVTATDALGAVSLQVVTPSDLSTGSFIGFVSTSTLVSLLVAPAAGDRFASIDNLTLGQPAPAPIPEPATVLMMAAGLLALRHAARRPVGSRPA
jgi:PEP-CTERM motif